MTIDPSTLGRIRDSLLNSDRAVRAESVDALASLGDRRGLRIALGSSDPYVRLRAVRALATEHGIAVAAKLVRKTADCDAQVRAAAAEGLAARPGCIAALALWRLTHDENVTVRYTVLQSLARQNWRWIRAMLAARG
jgi:HEAT repeat protein